MAISVMMLRPNDIIPLICSRPLNSPGCERSVCVFVTRKAGLRSFSSIFSVEGACVSIHQKPGILFLGTTDDHPAEGDESLAPLRAVRNADIKYRSPRAH